MSILLTGRGTSGSWAVRGVQLGHAIGAEVIPNATRFEGYDLAIGVKRLRPVSIHAAHAAGLPLIWDVVDAWPQRRSDPANDGNEWERERCMQWLSERLAQIQPNALVAATQAMEADCRELAPALPILTLPHHSRPGARLNPIRPVVRCVGYEGLEHYLGQWGPILKRECSARGWCFVINPAELAEVDIVVAFRDCIGHAAWRWKSNIKLANAQGTGTPAILSYEAGYRETASGAEWFVESVEELRRAMDEAADWERRQQAHQRMIQAAPYLDSVAAVYNSWLSQLKS